MCYGVIFGLALMTGQRYGIIDDSNHSNLMPKRPALAVTFLSLVGLAAASGYAFICPNSTDCDEVHSYSTFVPVGSQSHFISYCEVHKFLGMSEKILYFVILQLLQKVLQLLLLFYIY